jgi:predicted DNA-binding transcriptional regulator
MMPKINRTDVLEIESRVLSLLAENDGLRETEVARALELHRRTANNYLNQLQEKVLAAKIGVKWYAVAANVPIKEISPMDLRMASTIAAMLRDGIALENALAYTDMSEAQYCLVTQYQAINKALNVSRSGNQFVVSFPQHSRISITLDIPPRTGKEKLRKQLIRQILPNALRGDVATGIRYWLRQAVDRDFGSGGDEEE